MMRPARRDGDIGIARKPEKPRPVSARLHPELADASRVVVNLQRDTNRAASETIDPSTLVAVPLEDDLAGRSPLAPTVELLPRLADRSELLPTSLALERLAAAVALRHRTQAMGAHSEGHCISALSAII